MVQTSECSTREENVSLSSLVKEITQLENIIATWDDNQQEIVNSLKRAIETLHKEALTRIIRQVKDSAMPALKEAVKDEIVYGVLHYHDLIKAPLPERIQKALAEVRPSLNSHNGDVELISIRLPDTVEVRFIGNCSHCPASSLTLTDGVEQAIKRHCPEIVHVVALKGKYP